MVVKGNYYYYESKDWEGLSRQGLELLLLVFNFCSSPKQDSVTDTDDDLSHGDVQSKSLVVGGDCPEYSTLIDQTVLRYDQMETRKSALCLFEVNNGHPLRRHLSYNKDEGGFYGGLLDSVLTL
uniref:Amine oxidase n=1 Tax=Biomphalaria glabrata TaxID=6526 RepID=A0A2C9LG39_BIOGL